MYAVDGRAHLQTVEPVVVLDLFGLLYILGILATALRFILWIRYKVSNFPHKGLHALRGVGKLAFFAHWGKIKPKCEKKDLLNAQTDIPFLDVPKTVKIETETFLFALFSSFGKDDFNRVVYNVIWKKF
jgi:hypothetical protein